MIKLANYIRFLRLQKGLSQDNIAYDLGISVTAYSKIERGATNVSFLRLKQIAECLGITMTSLVDYYETGENNRSEQKKGNTYMQVTEQNNTIEKMNTRILELEEHVRVLKQAILDMREHLNNKEIQLDDNNNSLKG